MYIYMYVCIYICMYVVPWDLHFYLWNMTLTFFIRSFKLSHPPRLRRSMAANTAVAPRMEPAVFETTSWMVEKWYSYLTSSCKYSHQASLTWKLPRIPNSKVGWKMWKQLQFWHGARLDFEPMQCVCVCITRRRWRNTPQMLKLQ